MTFTKALVGSLVFWLLLCCAYFWFVRKQPIYWPADYPIAGRAK